MKTYFSIIFCLLSTLFYGQWIQQNSGVSTILNDVYGINNTTVIVVGNGGTLLKTTDGGLTWVPQVSGTAEDLLKIDFASSQVGYIGGGNGTFLKTVDGGETWSAISTGGTSYISDVSCVDENVIYIIGSGMLKRSSDAGLSFQTVNSNLFAEDVQFISALIGYTLSDGILHKTIDGGITWSEKLEDVESFFFYNSNYGYVNTADGLYRTIDGATTFSFLSTVDYLMLKIFAPSEEVVWGVSGELLLNGEPNFTMRGEFNDGEFEKEDGLNIFRSIYFTQETNGYAIGWEGDIYRNTTGLLGIPSVTLENKFKIFPNPAKEHVTISPVNFSQEYSVGLVDAHGRKVYSSTRSFDPVIINTQSLSPGVYIITIVSSGQIFNSKLIIN